MCHCMCIIYIVYIVFYSCFIHSKCQDAAFTVQVNARFDDRTVLLLLLLFLTDFS